MNNNTEYNIYIVKQLECGMYDVMDTDYKTLFVLPDVWNENKLEKNKEEKQS